MKNFILLIILLTFNNTIKSQVITTNRIPVGLEHNLLFNAGLGSGSVTASQIQGPAMNLNMMFDGSFLANYTTTAPSLANPVVILIEGLPNAHTQQGGFVGWSTRHWPAKKFKIEGYDVYTANNWVVLANYSTTDYTGNDFYIKVTPGSYTKLKFTFYEGTGTSGNLGLSELFFLHQEATAPYANLIGGGSKWILNGSNISFSTGNVGIGTNSIQTNTILDVRGMVGVGRQGIGGTYNSSQVQGIWSISPSYLINTTTNDFGTLYGMGYANTNAGTGSKKPIANFGHQIVYTSNGNVNASISLDNGNAYFQGNVGIGITSPEAKLHVAGTFLSDDPNYTNDWNTIWQTGFFQASDKPNAPEPTHWFWGINMGHSSNHATYRYGGQLVIRNSSTTPTMYFRARDVNGTGTWAKVLHSVGNQAIDGDLCVNGNINAKRIDITATVPCSDFVFEEDYNLRSLSEVEAFVKENKHLPEVPSAAEFKENGYSVGEMDDILLRKVEELTLYIIEQQKLIEQLQEKVETLEGK